MTKDCKTLADAAIKEYCAKTNAPEFLNTKAALRLKKLCFRIDELIKAAKDAEFDFSDVYFDAKTGKFLIDIVCSELVLKKDARGRFFAVLESAESFSFAKYQKEKIKITFVAKGFAEGCD